MRLARRGDRKVRLGQLLSCAKLTSSLQLCLQLLLTSLKQRPPQQPKRCEEQLLALLEVELFQGKGIDAHEEGAESDEHCRCRPYEAPLVAILDSDVLCAAHNCAILES